MTEQRRLAAILVADVVGYSKLVGSDEAGTLAQLQALRAEVIEPQIAKHAGRLFKSMGDGFLVEFTSAVQAVSCAKAIQEENNGRSLSLRIGIHVGDVVVQGDDLMGDGVNISARIEGVADPGGIAISREVHAQVRDRLDLGYVDKGEIELKHIARPMQVFVIGGVKTEVQATALPLPDKPSIAVLPFQNMSGDPEQEYFADGIVEDIITALSRFRSLFVIARNSSFSYKGQSPDVRQVGRDLGVRYVLEGSVRKAGGKVRITSQLIETESGAHLWADRSDGGLEDIFELQDRVTGSVVANIAPKLEQAEIERARRKPGNNVQAYDLLLRGQSFFRTDLDQSVKLLRKAVEIDPFYARGYAVLSLACWYFIAQGLGHRDHPAVADIVQVAKTALALDPNDPEVLSTIAVVFALPGGDPDTALTMLETAIALNPNDSDAFRSSAQILALAGQFERALENLRRADRLNPLDGGQTVNLGYSLVSFAKGEHQAVLDWTSRTLREHPNFAPALRYRAASLGLLGRGDEGRQVVQRILHYAPDYSITRARRHQEFDMNGAFKATGALEAFYEGLRLAGLPE